MYKQSKYNYFFPYKDKVYYINTLRGTSFPMKEAEHRRMKRLFRDPITFELEYPSVFRQFFEWGFFVDSSVREEWHTYYQFVDTYVNADDLYMAVLIGKDQVIDSAWIGRLRTYILREIDASSFRSVTLAWNGNHLFSFFEEQIYPLIREIEAACRERQIDCRHQFNMAMACDAVIHNKLFHRKGVPTYSEHISTMRFIADLPEPIRLNVLLLYKNNVSLEPFQAEWKGIESMTLLPKELKDGEVKPANDIYYVEKTSLAFARKNLLLIDPELAVYSTYMQYKMKRPVGRLHAEGILEWQALKREQDLFFPWFVRDKRCQRCKHFPVIKHLCAEYQVNERIGMCPVKNGIVSIDTLLQSFIEQTSHEI